MPFSLLLSVGLSQPDTGKQQGEKGGKGSGKGTNTRVS